MGHTQYTYAYNTAYKTNAIAAITDPKGYTQTFDTACDHWYVVDTIYTDRRGNDWKYQSVREDLQNWPANGPLSWAENPLAQRQTFVRDTGRNVTSLTDELGRVWLYEYDSPGTGNLTKATDPLGHVQTWVYDSLNNVTSYADAVGNQVTIAYDPTFPTLVKTITEPPDGQGNPTAVTTRTYYPDPLPACGMPEDRKFGQLKDVTDPNGVVTHFEYDKWGQVRSYAEGANPNGSGNVDEFVETFSVDSGSRTRASDLSCAGETGRALLAGGGAGGNCSYDRNNNTLTCGCSAVTPGGIADPGPCEPTTLPKLPCSPAQVPLFAPSSTATYSGFENLTKMNIIVSKKFNNVFDYSVRDHDITYNELNQFETSTITTNEPGQSLQRPFVYDYIVNEGRETRDGPDGIETEVLLDNANRVSSVRRGDPVSPMMTASYSYYANGLVNSVTYGNNAQTIYTYDVANRVTTITHTLPSGTILLQLDYTYTDHDLPATITESAIDGSLPLGTVNFAYDNRARLIHEYRLTGNATDMYHDMSYEYDEGGNRTRKVDDWNNSEVVYHYDIADPCAYGSANNRLVYSETLASVGGPVDSTSHYYYNCGGSVTRIVTNQTGSSQYTATRFGYAKNQRAVTYVMGESWDWTGDPATCPTSYQMSYAREFRYDGARQRYLNRELDPAGLMASQYVVLNDTWSDYDADDIYGDFSVSGATATELTSYEPGIARITDPLGNPTVDYYHTDHLGTTRTTTDDVGGFTQVRAKTAFGEPLTGQHDRFGYAGAWGYQAHTEFPQLHVGARYYDPASGRFLQRDPMGIVDGTNVYAYVANNPGNWIDPSGLGIGQWIKDVAKAIWEAVKTVVSPVDPTEHAAGAADCMMDDALRRHILRDHPEDPGPKPDTCSRCKELTPNNNNGGPGSSPSGTGPPPMVDTLRRYDSYPDADFWILMDAGKEWWNPGSRITT